jgi:hypothetical protein
MKMFHAVSEAVILGAVALGALVFTLAALAHAYANATIVW